MSDDRTVKKVFLGKRRRRNKSIETEIKVARLLSDMKWGAVRRWRKKAKERSAWAINLKEALAKL